MLATSPKLTIKPSEEQKTVIDWTIAGSGSGIVGAVAGSGKTSTLVAMLPHTKGSVAFCAYNKPVAVEIGQRVEPLGLGDRVKTGTCHSFGFGILRNVYKSVKVDSGKMRKLAKTVVKDYSLRSFAVAAASMAKQVGIGAIEGASWQQMIDHHSLYHLLPDGVSEMEGIAQAELLLAESNSVASEVVDFDDMIYIPVLRKMKSWKYDWVFLDEAQDTNPVRRGLVRLMLKDNGRLVAVGDPCQAIYGFTGADHESLDSIAKEFNAVHMPLTVTFRCPKSVVALANNWVSHIQAHESAPEGIVDEAKLSELVQNKEFGPEDAVLCRNTKPLIELAYRLIRNNVACRVEGRAIGEDLVKLASKWKKVKTVGDLRPRLDNWLGREIEKAIDKDRQDLCAVFEDQYESLMVFMDQCDDDDSLTTLTDRIRALFGDTAAGERQQVLTLSTIHKSKGREWNRVFALGMDRYSPSKWAKKPWERVQEDNLCYVQVTRAKKHLTLISGWE